MCAKGRTSATGTQNASVKVVVKPPSPHRGARMVITGRRLLSYRAFTPLHLFHLISTARRSNTPARPDNSHLDHMTMADELMVDMGYSIMTVNSQIIYKPTDERNDPEPDNDHEVYVGNLPVYYTIEKFVNFAK